MRLTTLFSLFFVALASLALPARAAEAVPADLVKAELLADVATVTAGKPFTVGVRLTMAPHWHTYWTNPGESGQAIGVKWTLPPGYTASELRFPVPTRFVQPGDLYGYGYEDEVMLTTTITPPAAVGEGPVDLAANVSWLVCKEICIPGKATVSLSLPTGDTAAPANAELFQKWTAHTPTDAAGVLVEGRAASMKQQGDDYVVQLRWTQPVKNVEWFAPAYGDGEIAEAKVQHDGPATTVTFQARPFDPKQPIDFKSLVATVAYVGPDGVRRGITVPLAGLVDAK